MIEYGHQEWETIVKDLKDWTKRCDVCQRTSRATVYDRKPIHAISRSISLFSHFFTNVIGPIFPDRKVRYHYCAVMVDQYSLWVNACPITAPVAKNICTSLIIMFSQTGLSTEVTVLASDNASYYQAELINT